MSPEILSGTMDFARFVSYTESDIYSVSLVLWEIFACCTVNGKWYRYACVCVCVVDLVPIAILCMNPPTRLSENSCM